MNTYVSKSQDHKGSSNAKSQNNASSAFRFKDNRPEALWARELQAIANNGSRVGRITQLQAMANGHNAQHRSTIQKRSGTPVNLLGEHKNRLSAHRVAGIDALSGHSVRGMEVNLNASKPAAVNAEATTQSNRIEVASGQEKHISHEAWPVVQQREGRVKPTRQLHGVGIDDDPALEKEADVMGQKAMVTGPGANMARTSKTQHPGSSVVQRNVGFEFELSNELLTYRRIAPGRYKSLEKKDRILNGKDFHVEADGLSGGSTSWEFVTVPFPETEAGLIRLIHACRAIDGIMHQIRRSPSGQYNSVSAHIRGFGEPVRNRYFNKTDPIRVKPQVTAGLSLAALDRLFRSLSEAPAAGVSDLARDTKFMNTYGQVPIPRQVEAIVGRARTESDNAIRRFFPNLNLGLEELRAFITQLCLFIIGGQQPIGVTPKTLLTVVMGRSDMKTVFNRLPNHLRNPLQVNPQHLVDMVIMAAEATLNSVLPRHEAVISANLFTTGLYANDPRANMPSPFLEVTREQWLSQLAVREGGDLLSAGNYPIRRGEQGRPNPTDTRANQLLDSMGSLHGHLDPGNRPVFEIRNSSPLESPLIIPYALDYFQYVRHLHNPALTESNELTQLSGEALASLLAYAPDREQLLYGFEYNAIAKLMLNY